MSGWNTPLIVHIPLLVEVQVVTRFIIYIYLMALSYRKNTKLTYHTLKIIYTTLVNSFKKTTTKCNILYLPNNSLYRHKSLKRFNCFKKFKHTSIILSKKHKIKDLKPQLYVNNKLFTKLYLNNNYLSIRRFLKFNKYIYNSLSYIKKLHLKNYYMIPSFVILNSYIVRLQHLSGYTFISKNISFIEDILTKKPIKLAIPFYGGWGIYRPIKIYFRNRICLYKLNHHIKIIKFTSKLTNALNLYSLLKNKQITSMRTLRIYNKVYTNKALLNKYKLLYLIKRNFNSLLKHIPINIAQQISNRLMQFILFKNLNFENLQELNNVDLLKLYLNVNTKLKSTKSLFYLLSRVKLNLLLANTGVMSYRYTNPILYLNHILDTCNYIYIKLLIQYINLNIENRKLITNSIIKLLMPYHHIKTSKLLYNFIYRTYTNFRTKQNTSLLTFNSRFKNLFVGLQFNKRCLLTLSSGMFYSDLYKYTISKHKKKELLEYRRNLKHHARKQYNRKNIIKRWKCAKGNISNKYLLARFLNLCLKNLILCVLDVKLKNTMKYTESIVNIALTTKNIKLYSSINNYSSNILIRYLYFTKNSINTSTKRVLKRKITKRLNVFKKNITYRS